MTTIAMVTLTQAGVTLLAIITAAIPAATASVANTPPGSTHARRCFRATTAAGAGDAALRLIADGNGLAASAQKSIPRPFVLTDRNHSNAHSIERHHTLAEEGTLIVTGRDSVPVAISIIIPVSVAVHEPRSNEALSIESSSVEISSVEALPIGATATEVATASTVEATALETAAPRTAALGRS